MSGAPAARASAARDTLDFTDIYRPGARAEIRSGIPAASLDAIDNTLAVCWLAYEHDHWLMDRTLAVLGQPDAVECWRRSIANIIERPLLRGFVDGAMRIFGPRAGKLIKLIPKAWPIAYRDFCVPGFHSLEEGRAELRFEQIAPEAFRSPGYIHCWHGICAGIFDLEKPENGKLQFEIHEDQSLAIARFSWGS